MTTDPMLHAPHPDLLEMRGEPEAMRAKAKRCRSVSVTAIVDMADSLSMAALQIEGLRTHINAMCGWAELLAEERGWTRENAASFWRSYDAARKVAHE